MNVLLINGSPNAEGCTYTALSEVANELNKNDIETTIFHVGNGAIQDCTACYGCLKSGYCIYGDDGVNECIELLKNANGVIIGSPVYYSGPTGALCSFLDRVFYLKQSNYAYKLGASIVSCRRAGSTSSLDRLNKYFTISNMPIVPSQYWCMVHGNSPEEVVKDLEGMQIMRTLGRNMAWLLKSIEHSKDSVPLPEKEKRVNTNFIR